MYKLKIKTKNIYMITFICFLITIFGCVNWLSIGMLQYDIIAGFFGTQASMFSRIIYIAFGFSALWIGIMAIRGRGKIHVFKNKPERQENKIEHKDYNRESELERINNDNNY